MKMTVGVPKEKSCEVEGMISSIKSTKEKLIEQLKQLENAEEKLNLDLKEIQSQPPNHPIIEFIKPIEMPDLDQDTLTEDESDIEDCNQITTEFEIGLSLSEESHLGTPTPASPPALSTPSRQVLSLNDEETAISDPLSDSALRGVRRGGVGSIQRSESPFASRGHFICGSSFFPILRSASVDDDCGESGLQHRINIRQAEVEESLQRTPEPAVDFRTGLSGHIALNTSHRKKSNQIKRNEIRTMGDHRGIGMVRRLRRHPDSPR